jgi:hypothetical protein
LSPDDGIAVRLVAPEEASLLIGLIRRCYGDTYIDPSFYDRTVVCEPAPAATETLRAREFSFAGLLPEYRDGDVLRMQWLAESVDE